MDSEVECLKTRIAELEAMQSRVLKLCDDMETHCGAERLDTPTWVATVRTVVRG